MVEQTGLIKKVVFLVYLPITSRDVDVWGFECLRTEGFDVQVYDLSTFLNGKALRQNPVRDALSADFITKIGSYQEFDSRVAEVASSCVFVDYIMGLAETDLKTEKVFRVLKKNGARYFAISAGALPGSESVKSATGPVGNWLKRVRLAANPLRLARFIFKKLIALLKKHTCIYALPYRIFGGDSEIVASYARSYRIGRDSIIPIHSLDYDRYLGYLAKGPVKPDRLDGTCVFLDEAASHPIDFTVLGIKPLGPEEYHRSMNGLFDTIESKTGLRVVIAAHPRSKYEEMPGLYGSRELVRGKCVELVASSSMVVAHASTALSFAVLFNKPILLVKTLEMSRHNHFSNSIDVMSYSLGVKAVTIGTCTMSFDYEKWPKDKYCDYKYRYVKTKGLADLTVWAVVSREIHTLNGECHTKAVL